jgi:Mrp family chromosome partitioning ATPase
MRFFPRRKRGDIDASRLHEHEAVRDAVARLLAVRESLADKGGARGETAAFTPGSFLFTSTREGQGTSTIAGAVARGLAESGRPTLLSVVGDPSGAKLPGAVTLAELAAGVQRVPSGQPPLLTVQVPARFTDFPESAHDLRGWLDGFQVLILDAPVVTDSLTRYFVPKVEGVVLVVDGEETAVKAVLQAREDLERLGGRLAGVVLNRYQSRLPRWIAPYYVYG